jgi:hypothetical protein
MLGRRSGLKWLGVMSCYTLSRHGSKLLGSIKKGNLFRNCSVMNLSTWTIHRSFSQPVSLLESVH